MFRMAKEQKDKDILEQENSEEEVDEEEVEKYMKEQENKRKTIKSPSFDWKEKKRDQRKEEINRKKLEDAEKIRIRRKEVEQPLTNNYSVEEYKVIGLGDKHVTIEKNEKLDKVAVDSIKITEKKKKTEQNRKKKTEKFK
ncbi:hypothetical protein Ciccas_002917 [Cichlidogyrus casuarinus]|uniref:Uncharacterized protein n=1 Tax=Cichlidogyrus casuarinus TaxID=1844966 RepID=A0ABD2QJ54_9PLAT